LLRNERSEEARTVAVQMIPARGGRRIDAAAPAACPFKASRRKAVGRDARRMPTSVGL